MTKKTAKAKRTKPEKVDPELARIDLEISEAERVKAKLEKRGERMVSRVVAVTSRLESLKKIRERLSTDKGKQ